MAQLHNNGERTGISPSSPARKPVYPKQQIDKSVRWISFAEINLSTTYGS
jgi:hypothetical protein